MFVASVEFLLMEVVMSSLSSRLNGLGAKAEELAKKHGPTVQAQVQKHGPTVKQKVQEGIARLGDKKKSPPASGGSTTNRI
jgi:hypothetical protein